MVVLHKVIRQTHFFELIFAVCLHEKTAAILENVRHEHNHISQQFRFDFDVHQLLG